jgi:NifU-like protein involved in Fe-S cluster formation
MFGELYHARVLELAAEIPHLGRLQAPHGAATKVSRICGSEVRVELALEDGAVTAFAIEPKACALGQAVASVLARHALGATPGEIRAARDALRAMLQDGAAPPEGRFWELRHVEAVRDYPPRRLSTMLAFDAAVAALDMAQARGPACG